MPYRLRLLDAIDWRIVGMTALFCTLINHRWLVYLMEGQFARVPRAVLETGIIGFLVLLFAALLFRWRALPRPIALALAVMIGCLAGRAVTMAPHIGDT